MSGNFRVTLAFISKWHKKLKIVIVLQLLLSTDLLANNNRDTAFPQQSYFKCRKLVNLLQIFLNYNDLVGDAMTR